MKKLIIILVVVAVVSIFAIPSVLFADPVDKVSAFVCPVFNANSQAGNKNPNAVGIAEGDKSILPGKAAGDAGHLNGPVSVPENATNSGAPNGPHSSPGDTDYTAIWKWPTVQ